MLIFICLRPEHMLHNIAQSICVIDQFLFCLQNAGVVWLKPIGQTVVVIGTRPTSNFEVKSESHLL